MVFWSVIAAMSALGALAVLWPLLRRPQRGLAQSSDASHEIAVYKDQLAEIERDKARGQITATEAEAARVEIARRLLKAADSAIATPTASGSLMGRRIAAVLALAVPVVGLALYSHYGTPELPDQTIAARLANAEANDDLPAMMRKVELALEKNPKDARGWQVLAPLYLRTRQPEKAALAIANIMRLTGETADLDVELASALIEASTPENIDPRALAAVDAALKLNPAHPKAHFIHAYVLSATGKTEDAKAELQALKANSPASAPWMSNVDSALAALNMAQPAAPGPTASDVQGAAQMSADDRTTMIATMVQRLADKLHANPKDMEGWLRLIRAYIVLKKPDAVKSAAQEARAAFAGDATALSEIDRAEQGGE